MIIAGSTWGGEWDRAVFVALGANLGGVGPYGEARVPQATIEAALARLPAAGLTVLARSRLWRSSAWPDARRPAYFNAVAHVETTLSPDSALAALHELEASFGRVRGACNADRTLDLDLIAFGRRVQPGRPVLPHPRAAERLFVMGPLAELAPGWRHPTSGLDAAALARAATVGRDAAPA